MPTTIGDLTTVVGLAFVLLILAQIVKEYLPERFITLCVIGAGIVIAVAATLALGESDAVSIGNAILTGFLAGAAATGLYDLQKPLGWLAPKG